MKISYDLTISLVDTYPNEMKTFSHRKTIRIYTMKHDSAIKHDTLKFAYMNL
jgi:hypothetical protein